MLCHVIEKGREFIAAKHTSPSAESSGTIDHYVALVICDASGVHVHSAAGRQAKDLQGTVRAMFDVPLGFRHLLLRDCIFGTHVDWSTTY